MWPEMLQWECGENEMRKGQRMNKYTDFLFARPSFLEGVARVLDLGGTLQEYNRSLSEEDADFIALAADTKAVGDDLWAALRRAVSEDGVTLGEGE